MRRRFTHFFILLTRPNLPAGGPFQNQRASQQCRALALNRVLAEAEPDLDLAAKVWGVGEGRRRPGLESGSWRGSSQLV